MKRRLLPLLVLSLVGCSTVYYNTMEKMGVHKRDIMVDRVKAAKDAQQDAKVQFVSAMEQFKSVVKFKGGDLEKEYEKLNAVLMRSEAEANKVHSRVESVEAVSDALFDEWRAEIKKYSSDTLKKSSQVKYDATKRTYEELITAMKKAESKLEPALIPLRDQVMYLKHNLNAKAITGLSDELITVQTNVDKLVKEIELSIAQADKFIDALQEQ